MTKIASIHKYENYKMLTYISRISQSDKDGVLSFIKDLDRIINNLTFGEIEEQKILDKEESDIAFLKSGWAVDPAGLGIVACSDPERLKKSRGIVNG